MAPPHVRVNVLCAEEHPHRWKRNLRLLKDAWCADVLVIHFSLHEVLFFSLLLYSLPFCRCKLVTLDFFVVSPQPWMKGLVRWSLGRIDKLLVYFRDSSSFQKMYGVPAARFVYIPFKVNSWDLVRAAAITDEGYIFVGGRSRRDFKTLFEAVKDLPYPVKLLTAKESDITPHGSSLAGLTVPPNVQIFYNDSDSKTFVGMMAAARLVVLPIVPSATIQAGIGVYLLGMALHKCVVISEALGVSDVLLEGQACILPAGDVAALRNSIERLWNDDALRTEYADKGYRYATALGGDDQLRKSILQAIVPAAD